MKVLPYLALASFIAGIGMLLFGYFEASKSGSSTPPEAPLAAFTVTPTPIPSATATPVPSPTATPVPYDGKVARFQIPRFKVDAAVEDIGIQSNNELAVPSDPTDVGWYGIYQKPGFDGNALFAAHVDYYGRDPNTLPFHDLKDLTGNDQVVVQMDNGLKYTYQVYSLTRYKVLDNPSVASLPQIQMGDIIAGKGLPTDHTQWITLITCGNTGPFVYVSGNSGPVEYLTRDVVVAYRVS